MAYCFTILLTLSLVFIVSLILINSQIQLRKEYTTEIERLRRDLEATRDGTGVFLAHDNYVQMMARLDSQDGELGDNIQRIRALEEEREKKEIICDRLNMELEKKTQELEETTQNLQMTQSNLVATREDLHNTEEQRDETQELLLNHVVTEKELGAQAVQLLKVADASTTDLHRVHDKLDRKRSVERQNAESVQQFLEKFTHQVAHMKESSQLHSEEQAQQLTEISKQLGAALESFHTIETACQTRAAAFLESHTHNLQVFEKELRSQAEAQQQWSSSQIQFEREHVSAQVSALQATHAQAQATMQTLTEAVNQLGNVFSAAIQSAIQQIDKQSHRVQSQTLKQVEQIATMNQHMLSFTQQVSDNLQQYRDELNAMKEHDNNIFQMEEEERKYFAEMIKSMHLFQEKQNSRKSKQDEKSKYYGNMADIIDKQETVNKESSAVYEKQLIDIDEQSSILLSEHTQFSKDLSKSMKSMSSEMNDRFDGLINQHKAVCSDISNLETMVEKGWQTHSDTLEQQLRQHAEAAQDDLQVQTSQLQNLKTLMVQQTEDQSAFADAREKSLGEHMVASQAVIREHSTTAEEWSEQHSRELLEISQDVHAFLTQGIKCDQPTGATPQRRTLDFPRTLKATSPHERILERFRAARVKQRLPTKCHSVDSVIAASSSDEASLSRSTSASSLSSPEDRIMVDKENTSDTLIINKDSLKVNQKSPLLNRKIQSNQSLKSKRKVLTNQN